MIKKPTTIAFDPSIKGHRAAARAFLRRRCWADSPLRFSHDPEYTSLDHQVQTKLLKWYLDQEEAKDTRKKSKARVENIREIKVAGLPTNLKLLLQA